MVNLQRQYAGQVTGIKSIKSTTFPKSNDFYPTKTEPRTAETKSNTIGSAVSSLNPLLTPTRINSDTITTVTPNVNEIDQSPYQHLTGKDYYDAMVEIGVMTPQQAKEQLKSDERMNEYIERAERKLAASGLIGTGTVTSAEHSLYPNKYSIYFIEGAEGNGNKIVVQTPNNDDLVISLPQNFSIEDYKRFMDQNFSKLTDQYGHNINNIRYTSYELRDIFEEFFSELIPQED